MARKRLLNILECSWENASSLTKHHVLESNDGVSQDIERGPPKCEFMFLFYEA